MKKLNSKPYYTILPPLFDNMVEKAEVSIENIKEETSEKNDISLIRNFYKPICSLIDLNNEVFEIIS